MGWGWGEGVHTASRNARQKRQYSNFAWASAVPVSSFHIQKRKEKRLIVLSYSCVWTCSIKKLKGWHLQPLDCSSTGSTPCSSDCRIASSKVSICSWLNCIGSWKDSACNHTGGRLRWLPLPDRTQAGCVSDLVSHHTTTRTPLGPADTGTQIWTNNPAEVTKNRTRADGMSDKF